MRTALCVAALTAAASAQHLDASGQVDEMIRILQRLECTYDFLSGGWSRGRRLEQNASQVQNVEQSQLEGGGSPFIVGQRQKPARGDDDFLIRNTKDNDVTMVQCPTPEKLNKALLRFEALPHLAVMGESNAGKSSLINSLLRKQHAKASSVAGKTKSVDLMKINERFVQQLSRRVT